jgi:hypothetical protein
LHYAGAEIFCGMAVTNSGGGAHISAGQYGTDMSFIDSGCDVHVSELTS